MRRTLTAIIGLPIGVAVIYAGGAWLACGMGLLTLLALAEYFSVAQAKGLSPFRVVGYASVPCFLVAAHLDRGAAPEKAICLLVAVFVLVSMAAPALKGRTSGAIADCATTLGGICYVSLLFSFIVLLRNRPGEVNGLAPWRVSLEAGFVFVFYLVAVSWLTDTGAFFAGRAFGLQRLAPHVSPNKTLEGAAGGILAAVVVGIPLGVWLGLPAKHASALALLGAVVGQLGDLAKSALKRDAGVKDFASLFPGHGGVLDRFDSILFNAPLFYFYFRLVGY